MRSQHELRLVPGSTRVLLLNDPLRSPLLPMLHRSLLTPFTPEAFSILVLAMAAPLLVACDPSTDPDHSSIVWGSCPPGFERECAYVSVPLDHAEPHGEMIELLVSRRPASVQPATAQLWLVHGGPGISGFYFSTQGVLDELAFATPSTDLYVIEHRGVGYSSQLTCPDQQADTSPGGLEVVPEELLACAQSIDDQYGGGLASFSVAHAAGDIEQMLRLTDEDDLPQFVYGVSYGTQLVQRFLQLYPDAADGVILDSIAVPEQRLNDYDTQADPVMKQLADRCAADPICSEKLGTDPWAMIRATVDALEHGHCAASGLTGPSASPLLWLGIDFLETREMLLPLLYRLSRCEPEDVLAAQHATQWLQEVAFGVPPELATLDTQLLTGHLTTSEFIERPFDADQLLAACENATFCPGLAAQLLPFWEQWPRYDDATATPWPEFRGPVLAFNGDLDVKTPIELASLITQHLAGPHQNFYTFPDGPHFLAHTSRVRTEDAPTCAVQMIADFVADPYTPPDDRCLHDLVPFEPNGSPDDAMRYFGTTELW